MVLKNCLYIIALLGVVHIYALSNFDFSYLSIPRTPIPDVNYFDCGDKEQSYKHPWDCTRFIQCGDDGHSSDQPCPPCDGTSQCKGSPYLYFDVEKNICYWPEEISCNCNWENIVNLHKSGRLHSIGSLSNFVFANWTHFSKCGSGPGNCNWIDFADCALKFYKSLIKSNPEERNVTMDTLCRQFTKSASAQATEDRKDKNCDDLECKYHDNTGALRKETYGAPPEGTPCDKVGGRCKDGECHRGGSELMQSKLNNVQKTLEK